MYRRPKKNKTTRQPRDGTFSSQFGRVFAPDCPCIAAAPLLFRGLARLSANKRRIEPCEPGCASLIALLILTTVASPVLAQAEVPAAAAPAAGGLVGLCAMIDAKIKECKKKICECPLGQTLTAATKVFNLYGGGLLCPSCCPEVKEDDLKKASNTPQGACARIRKEEEEAPDRRAARALFGLR